MLGKKNYTHMYNNVYINICSIYIFYILYKHTYIYIIYLYII